MQRILAFTRGRNVDLELPPAWAEVLPGIMWGRFDVIFTPAYWRGQAWQHDELGTYAPGAIGHDLAEEVSACLLGGYGIPAELGVAAFSRLQEMGLLRGTPAAADLELALSTPFLMSGRPRRYRFPKAKAQALAGALRGLPSIDLALPDRALRDALTSLSGVGQKTASWVVRNFRSSDKVAIIDVHIARAGRIAGFISPHWDPARHYALMEQAFLRFAEAISVRASVLDGLMWDHMRRLGDLAREDEASAQTVNYRSGSSVAFTTPIAAVPQATILSLPGNKAAAISLPSKPNGQKPSPMADAQRCRVASSAPASRQSRLPGFA